jgi:hypothetical protein
MTLIEARARLTEEALKYAGNERHWEARERLCQAAKKYAAVYRAEKQNAAASSAGGGKVVPSGKENRE